MYVTSNQDIKHLQEKEIGITTKLQHLYDQVPLKNLNETEKTLQKKLLKLRKDISNKLQNNKLEVRKGPVTSNLDTVLQRNKITPQAYHGRSVVGNHCSKYLRTEVHEDLCHSITQLTAQLTNETSVITRAYCIRETWKYGTKQALFTSA
jgi:predicted metal-dependent hydrolase